MEGLAVCEKHKTKHSSHGMNIPTKKQSTDLSTLSKQDKNTFETSHILTTDQEMDTETLITKDFETLEIPTYMVSPTSTENSTSNMASPTALASTENLSSSVHQINDLVYQNDQNANGNESLKGEFKNQTNTKPLKVRVKRYSTKKYNKHHVEEVKVDFYSKDSSSSDEDGAATNIA